MKAPRRRSPIAWTADAGTDCADRVGGAEAQGPDGDVGGEDDAPFQFGKSVKILEVIIDCANDNLIVLDMGRIAPFVMEGLEVQGCLCYRGLQVPRTFYGVKKITEILSPSPAPSCLHALVVQRGWPRPGGGWGCRRVDAAHRRRRRAKYDEHVDHGRHEPRKPRRFFLVRIREIAPEEDSAVDRAQRQPSHNRCGRAKALSIPLQITVIATAPPPNVRSDSGATRAPTLPWSADAAIGAPRDGGFARQLVNHPRSGAIDTLTLAMRGRSRPR